MRNALRAIRDGIGDLATAPGLFLLALVHTAMAALVFGLALGVTGGVANAWQATTAWESRGVITPRLLDPAVTGEVEPTAVSKVTAAFQPVLDEEDPTAFVATDAITVEDPRAQGALFATTGLTRFLGVSVDEAGTPDVYFAPAPVTAGLQDGTVYIGAVPYRYAGPLPPGAAAPVGDGSIRPLTELPVFIIDSARLADLVSPSQLTTVFGSLVADPQARPALRSALDVLEEETGVLAELTAVTTTAGPLARQARGVTSMTVAYTLALASAALTVVSLMAVLSQRLTRTWLAHLLVGAPAGTIGLRIATAVTAVWTIPALVGALAGCSFAAGAGGLAPAPSVVALGLVAVLLVAGACTAAPLLRLRRVFRSASLLERTSS